MVIFSGPFSTKTKSSLFFPVLPIAQKTFRTCAHKLSQKYFQNFRCQYFSQQKDYNNSFGTYFFSGGISFIKIDFRCNSIFKLFHTKLTLWTLDFKEQVRKVKRALVSRFMLKRKAEINLLIW